VSDEHVPPSGVNRADPRVATADVGEDDRRRRRVLWRFPAGLYVVGAVHRSQRNLMTASWVTQVSLDPKLVGVGIERQAVSHTLVEDGGVFALSLVARGDRTVVRRFVKPVDAEEIDVDHTGAGTIRSVPVRVASTGAPILAAAAAYVDCVVRDALTTGTHTWFVGEVVDSGFGPAGEDVEVLRMEDTRMNYGG
jgi:flavin reductase (DIM6/NTAB) family NADH-FMN oxidoreductase RutF